MLKTNIALHCMYMF